MNAENSKKFYYVESEVFTDEIKRFRFGFDPSQSVHISEVSPTGTTAGDNETTTNEKG